MAADHGVIVIVTVHHKISNKTAGTVLWDQVPFWQR